MKSNGYQIAYCMNLWLVQLLVHYLQHTSPGTAVGTLPAAYQPWYEPWYTWVRWCCTGHGLVYYSDYKHSYKVHTNSCIPQTKSYRIGVALVLYQTPPCICSVGRVLWDTQKQFQKTQLNLFHILQSTLTPPQ